MIKLIIKLLYLEKTLKYAARKINGFNFFIKNKFMDHFLSISFALVFFKMLFYNLHGKEKEMKEKTDFWLKGVIEAYLKISALSS